jgi:hypothetical protein
MTLLPRGLFPLVLLLLFSAAAEACTVGLAAGRTTVDGRPLLWKNRDSSTRENEIAYFHGPQYDFVGVINANDTTQVWMGVNRAGFAIMNSESLDQPGDSVDTEGFFMKKALGQCRTLDDFESLLRTTNHHKRGTQANFGCIDAFGGAAFYETGNTTFTKFDANDALHTPEGFLIRANFSMTGQDEPAYGTFRMHRARELFQQAVDRDDLNAQTILQAVTRDLVSTELDPYPLPFNGSIEGAPRGYIPTRNSINRYRTVSAVVFQGVRPGENPALTTMWCILGEPIAGVAVPIWVLGGELPESLNGEDGSELNERIRSLRDQLYPDSDRPEFLDTHQLFRKQLPVATEFLPFERDLYTETQKKLTQWRLRRPSGESVQTFERQLIQRVLRFLR